MELPAEVREKLGRMQEMQQQAQSFLMQKQNIQVQKLEVENALKELENSKSSDSVFEIVGTVMLRKSSEELKTSLGEKKDIYELRLKTITKQIDKLTEESKKLQEDIFSQVKR